MKTIILTLIALIIYDLLRKLLKYFFVKKSNDKLNDIINNSVKIFPLDFEKIDNEEVKKFWEEE